MPRDCRAVSPVRAAPGPGHCCPSRARSSPGRSGTPGSSSWILAETEPHCSPGPDLANHTQIKADCSGRDVTAAGDQGLQLRTTGQPRELPGMGRSPPRTTADKQRAPTASPGYEGFAGNSLVQSKRIKPQQLPLLRESMWCHSPAAAPPSTGTPGARWTGARSHCPARAAPSRCPDRSSSRAPGLGSRARSPWRGSAPRPAPPPPLRPGTGERAPPRPAPPRRAPRSPLPDPRRRRRRAPGTGREAEEARPGSGAAAGPGAAGIGPAAPAGTGTPGGPAAGAWEPRGRERRHGAGSPETGTAQRCEDPGGAGAVRVPSARGMRRGRRGRGEEPSWAGEGDPRCPRIPGGRGISLSSPPLLSASRSCPGNCWRQGDGGTAHRASRSRHRAPITPHRAPYTGHPALSWPPAAVAGFSGGHSPAGTVARCVAHGGASMVGAAALEGPKTPTSRRGAAASPCPPRPPVAPPLAGSLRAGAALGSGQAGSSPLPLVRNASVSRGCAG